MSLSPKASGHVMRARIGTLRLRVAAGGVRSAKALASTVASNLALRLGELRGRSGGEAIRAQMRAPASSSQDSLAAAIADRIARGR